MARASGLADDSEVSQEGESVTLDHDLFYCICVVFPVCFFVLFGPDTSVMVKQVALWGTCTGKCKGIGRQQMGWQK